ncbi:serine hydrolase [Kordiimonas pumila]|uniref:Serine hydrolase n=1 Tax=Kordiimonas pumila TaxID=2161677 RepID=A0ABV7D781_9PROT|nr:serine hydrolase [Kordiimonas pumila]
MLRKFYILLVSIPLVLLSFTAKAEIASAETITKAATELLDREFPADAPGIAVLVAQGDKVLFSGARGLANVELGIPVAPDNVFRIGSVTKQFAATALLKLVQEGKAKLDDPLSKYLPEYPNGDDITLVHLLNHTSGVNSYTGIENYFTDGRIQKDLSTEQMIDVFKDLPVDFAPGEKFAYNNSGYVLVGAVIEAITGRPWYDYIEKELLVPNGILRTQFGSNTRLIHGAVSGYEYNNGVIKPATYLSMTQPHAAGALTSNVYDLMLWNRTVHTGKILDPEMYKRFITPEGVAADVNYAFAVTDGDIRGHKSIQHGGGINGFITYLLYIPDEEITVAAIQNSTGTLMRSERVAKELASVAVADPMPTGTPVTRSNDELKKYVGTYANEEGAVVTLKLEGDTLICTTDQGPRGYPQTQPLKPLSDGTFEVGMNSYWLSFSDGKKGVSTLKTVFMDTSKGGTFKRK